jgi:hypothetical protein
MWSLWVFLSLPPQALKFSKSEAPDLESDAGAILGKFVITLCSNGTGSLINNQLSLHNIINGSLIIDQLSHIN